MVHFSLFSQVTTEWSSPDNVYLGLHAEFGFELDVCATKENARCKCYFTKTENGLKQPWKGVCWMNPPYGRVIDKWVEKAFESARSGYALVVCLLPVRSDTKWWHRYVLRGEIRFLKVRLRFGGAKNSAPFPSAVVIFRPPKLTG